jgi:predicted membrane-bound dolichyl-phosphate-mannose-protein mannosyltransferase
MTKWIIGLFAILFIVGSHFSLVLTLVLLIPACAVFTVGTYELLENQYHYPEG